MVDAVGLSLKTEICIYDHLRTMMHIRLYLYFTSCLVGSQLLAFAWSLDIPNLEISSANSWVSFPGQVNAVWLSCYLFCFKFGECLDHLGPHTSTIQARSLTLLPWGLSDSQANGLRAGSVCRMGNWSNIPWTSMGRSKTHPGGPWQPMIGCYWMWLWTVENVNPGWINHGNH